MNRALTFILGLSIVLNFLLVLSSDRVVGLFLPKTKKVSQKKIQFDQVHTGLSSADKKLMQKAFFRPETKTVEKKIDIKKRTRLEEIREEGAQAKADSFLSIEEYLEDKFYDKPTVPKKVVRILKELDKYNNRLIDQSHADYKETYGEEPGILTIQPDIQIKMAKEKLRTRYKLIKLLGKKNFDKLLKWHNYKIQTSLNEGAEIDSWIDI